MSTFHFAETPHTMRPAQFAGICYPNNPTKLAKLLDEVIDKPHTTLFSNEPVKQGASAIIAPHIDFRVGLSVYGPAYYALQNSDADVFVIFATSHYAWGNLFIPTFQHFSTPLGTAQTDHELLQRLYAKLPTLAKDDEAHKEEHSIEFEMVFLQHLFGHRAFTVLPILVTSFYPFIQKNVQPAETDTFRRFCDTLREVLQESGKKVAFVASADMAHIGRKFDDKYDAEPMLPKMHDEDMRLLEALERSDAHEYYRRIANVQDAYKICGLPPVYSMLETVRCSGGTALSYEQWNEVPTRSAVTYSSMAFYDHLL
jgi:AmmeMemoRadiSam system protein B